MGYRTPASDGLESKEDLQSPPRCDEDAIADIVGYLRSNDAATPGARGWIYRLQRIPRTCRLSSITSRRATTTKTSVTKKLKKELPKVQCIVCVMIPPTLNADADGSPLEQSAEVTDLTSRNRDYQSSEDRRKKSMVGSSWEDANYWSFANTSPHNYRLLLQLLQLQSDRAQWITTIHCTLATYIPAVLPRRGGGATSYGGLLASAAEWRWAMMEEAAQPPSP
ncbi:hypothetical protein BZA05DRAFT_465783 [Tricharina praecox]|uniref:uncharacterized protein n=1 Tax=Tricharina praecox TaxID=43433 RepID=UPI0022204451|nr:uncharacterized protein BZA05DRAFT_465783 [Tricharina praecox]KAI5855174.1 hypothetical protein BZA05DRAFT_465783 [Tricharina praecox]